jgi:aspartate ammonia-lyase
VGEDVERLHEASRLLHEMNLGATAIGTGLNTVEGYASAVRDELVRLTGLPLVTAPNLVEATSDAGAVVQLSGVLKRVAVKLSKICNDLRLLSSGPRAGFGEIRLPAVQPGSTIMPGKVNPVIAEAMNQVCFQVVGHDAAITIAAQSGQLELNAFEPLIGYSLLESLRNLSRGVTMLRERCIEGIEADVERCRALLDSSIGVVTALVPLLGYERAAEIAAEALRTGRLVVDLARERAGLDPEQLHEVLNPRTMTHPRAIPSRPKG